MPVSTLHFVAGYQLGEWVAASAVASCRLAVGYSFKPKPTLADSAADWAVLTLAEPIGAETGIVPPTADGRAAVAQIAKAGLGVSQAGYSRDKKHILTVHRDCRLLRYRAESGLADHDCDTVSGDSGSPILRFDGGDPRIVAIHVATLSADAKGRRLGLAVALPPLADWPALTRSPN
ncbi:MAG: hypothetical protein VW405_02735 [Rhodospirillaceae bacterium]